MPFSRRRPWLSSPRKRGPILRSLSRGLWLWVPAPAPLGRDDAGTLRDQQYLAEVLVAAHVLVGGLGVGERISLVDRHLDPASLHVVPQIGAHFLQDVAHLLDGAGAERDADVINALSRMQVEVELRLH